MIVLDMKTVMIGNIIINTVCLLVTLQLWYYYHNKYAGLSYWVADWAFQAGGALLIALRDIIPDWASMVLSNSMIVGGTFILCFGLWRFIGKKNNRLINYSLLTYLSIFILIHSYFTYIQNSLLARSLNTSVGLSLACFLGAWLMFWGVGQEFRRIAKGTGISFAFIILINLVRIIGFMLVPNTSNNYMQSGFFDTLLVALLSGSIMFLVFNLVLMVSRRLLMESERSESALKEITHLLNETGTTARIGGWELDVKTKVQKWSEEVYRIHEVEMDYQPTLEKGIKFYTPEAIPIISNAVQQAIDHGAPFDLELPFITAKGKQLSIHAIGKAYKKNGKTIRIGGTFQDITKRKLAEAEVELRAHLLDNATDSIFLHDLEGNFIYMNESAYKTRGYTKDELMAINLHELDIPEYAKLIQPRIQYMIEHGEVTFESVHLNKNGTLMPVEIHALALNINGKKQILSVIRDITDRKDAEEKIRQGQEALAIVNNKLEERNRQNSLMSEMRDLLQSCSIVQEVPTIVLSYIVKIFPDTDGALFLLNNSQTFLQSVAKWGDFPEDVDNNIFAPDACWGLKLGRVYLVEDVKIGPICPHIKQVSAVAYICLPLIGKGEILGLLHLGTRRSVQGNSAHRNIADLKETAVMFAEYLSLSIANIKLSEKLAGQSIRDTLTGLFNRRYMEETIQREILRAERKKTKIGIVMADIDHFKQINDTYGHKAGDEFLIKLAEFIKLKTRGSDIACRYGGEEFILILPESATEDTYKRVDFLRKEIGNMKVYFLGQLLPPITLSFGIATYPDHGKDINEIIRVADAALYKAKEEGRDRVIIG